MEFNIMIHTWLLMLWHVKVCAVKKVFEQRQCFFIASCHQSGYKSDQVLIWTVSCETLKAQFYVHEFLCPLGGKTPQFSTRYDRKTLKLCCHDNESQTASTNHRGWLHTIVGCSKLGPTLVIQILGDTFVTKQKKSWRLKHSNIYKRYVSGLIRAAVQKLCHCFVLTHKFPFNI